MMIKEVNLNIDLKEIPNLSFEDLRKLYFCLFDYNIKSTRREFFIWRITNRLQELRYGGLDSRTINLLENLENNPIQKQQSFPIGTEITKKYKGEIYKFRVVMGGFEMNGEFYKSLSAVAYKVTGRKISGKEFFGV